MLQTTMPAPGLPKSRSGKVLIQLQEHYERLQKDLASTRAQLETAREAKKRAQFEAQEYVESNTQYRAEIQALMRTLDAKQQQVHQSKVSSQSMEAEVKRLKHEAAKSRKQLEAAMEKNKQESEEQARLDQHYKVLQESIQSGPQRELERLRQELKVVNTQLAIVAERSQLVSKIYESKAYRWAEEQHQHIAELRRMRNEVQATTQAFVDHVRLELESLQSTIHTEESDIESSVARCQSDMNGLLVSIRLYSQQADA